MRKRRGRGLARKSLRHSRRKSLDSEELLWVFGRLFVVFTLLGAFVWLMHQDFLRLQYIVVNDTEYTSVTEIEEALEEGMQERALLVFPKSNYFFFDTEEVSRNLREQFPRLTSATIAKELIAHTVYVSVEERELWAVLCLEPRSERENAPEMIDLPQTCHYLSYDGVSFGRAPEFRGSLVLKIFDERIRDVTEGSVGLPASEVEMINTFIDAADRFLNLNRLQFRFEKTENIVRISHEEGWDIISDTETDPNVAVENLLLSLRQQIKDDRDRLEYVDLRYGNKIFYRTSN